LLNSLTTVTRAAEVGGIDHTVLLLAVTIGLHILISAQCGCSDGLGRPVHAQSTRGHSRVRSRAFL